MNPDTFIVRYWGVRGSIPSPGPDTVRYGGNTTCIEIQCGGERIIIDAGSGIRRLGNALAADGGPVRATFLFSHLHWDHIQGFPFFTPYFTPGNRFDIWAAERVGGSLLDVLRGQMAQPTFPISLDAMPAELIFHEISAGASFRVGEHVEVHTAGLNHPGGATAFRIEYRGRAFVHASDHEHQGAVPHAPLVALARGADAMCYDATYTDAEYSGADGQGGHEGWGHSTWQEAVRVAAAADVGRLILFHHDPSHTDATLDLIGAEAARARPGTVVAREGMEVDLLAGTVAAVPG